MEETRKIKTWDATELSYLYHLCIWAYEPEKIKEILKPILDRSKDSIGGALCNMRKYISKQQGHPIQHWAKGPHTEAKFAVAIAMGVPTEIEKHRRYNTTMKPSFEKQSVADIVKSNLDMPDSTSTPTPAATQPAIITPESNPEKEPTILDVMRLAKELQATEVEYKGMKIRY